MIETIIVGGGPAGLMDSTRRLTNSHGCATDSSNRSSRHSI
jgi:hypothetical protein